MLKENVSLKFEYVSALCRFLLFMLCVNRCVIISIILCIAFFSCVCLKAFVTLSFNLQLFCEVLFSEYEQTRVKKFANKTFNIMEHPNPYYKLGQNNYNADKSKNFIL